MNTTNPRYFMATVALGRGCNLSREKPDLCRIWEENDISYIGEWVTGLGFINVVFPKETTRELTDEEREYFADKVVVTAGFVSPLNFQPKESK